MTEIGAILELLRRRPDDAAVMVTLTKVVGSSYRRPGARLLWFEDGTRTGGISGGCLEEDVVGHARAVFRSHQSKVLVYDTTAENDLVWGTGTGCDGQVTLLLEYIPARRLPWLHTLAENYRANRPTALDVSFSGDSMGTCLAAPKMDVPGFRDMILPPQKLMVFGAGDDAQPLVSMAATMGWNVAVVDSRQAYLTPERFPGARHLVLSTPTDETWKKLHADTDTPVVIMTHRYREDRVLLSLVLSYAERYVGMLGPRKRTERLLAELTGEGFRLTDTMRQVLHAPVGLNLGGTTPAGIALAILAEIQACLAQSAPMSLRDRPGKIHA